MKRSYLEVETIKEALVVQKSDKTGFYRKNKKEMLTTVKAGMPESGNGAEQTYGLRGTGGARSAEEDKERSLGRCPPPPREGRGAAGQKDFSTKDNSQN